MSELSNEALAQLFTEARTHNGWQEKDVPEELLHRLHDTVKWGPTSTNCCPMRVVFVRSKAAKEKLAPCLMTGNVEKTMKAPVTAIICYDTKFYEKLPTLSPHNNAISWFTSEGKQQYALNTATQNGTIQAGYFILAARALGLDCGPMSGFNTDKVNEAFLSGTSWKSNILVNLGYGDPEKLYPRAARLPFNEACRID